MEIIQLEILNWDKFNPRKDIKRPHWFAFDNRMLEDPKLFDFSPEEKLAWIYILCLASQYNGPIIEIYPVHAKAIAGIPEKALRTAVDKLIQRGCTALLSPRTDETKPTYGSVRVRTSTEQDTTEQNKQNIAHANAFADFYAKYPRKIGKKAAKKAYVRERKSGASHEEICAAREKFKHHHINSGTDPNFIPYPATFLSGWQDWLDPETGTTSLPKKPVIDWDAIDAEDAAQGVS